MPFNVFFALRHGQSEANAEGLIVSDPVNGVPRYGLTDKGRREAEAAAREVEEIMKHFPGHRLVIATSDFRRARETAEALRSSLAPDAVADHDFLIEQRLRERNFGELELQDSSRYAEVWKHDEVSASHSNFQVEPVESVARRASAAVQELDAKYDRAVVLLSSHGDTLQILLSASQGLDLRLHRSLPHLGNCGLRRLAGARYPHIA